MIFRMQPEPAKALDDSEKASILQSDPCDLDAYEEYLDSLDKELTIKQ